MRAVAKRSAQKAGSGGRKWAFRVLTDGVATTERIVVGDDEPVVGSARALTVPLMSGGQADHGFIGVAGVRAARDHHASAMRELPSEAMRLSGGDPAIPTVLG